MTGRTATTDVVVALPDGTRLATEVTTVDDGARRPALLVRTPYSRPAARETLDVHDLARCGWAVVLQDVRGRWDSAGEFSPFVQEADDGADVVAWCARQPWCNGRVVTAGASYLGAAQWAAASRRPPALVAISPTLTAATPPSAWLWQGGAFQIGMAAPWLLTMRASTQGISADDAARVAAEIAAWRRAPEVVPDDRWLMQNDADYRAWRAGSAAEDWHGAAVPAFNVVGWQDFFAEAGLAAHARQVDSGVAVTTVIGPWPHGADAVRAVQADGLAWLWARLDGEPLDSEIRYVVGATGEWRRARTWPPETEPLALFLTDGGHLRPAPQQHARAVSWRHEPSAPVPSCGGRVLGPFLPLGGAHDQRSVEGRPDVLTFTTGALEHPLVVTGRVGADLAVDSTARSFDIAVKLCDVHPDGRSVNVVDGIRRIDSGAPAQPVHVEVGSTAYAFADGHRVRLEVAGSNFPRFDINPAVAATHTLRTGGATGSVLHLPVAPGG